MRDENQEINGSDDTLTRKMRVPVKTVVQDIADQKKRGEAKGRFLAKSMQLPIAGFYGYKSSNEKSCSQRI